MVRQALRSLRTRLRGGEGCSSRRHPPQCTAARSEAKPSPPRARPGLPTAHALSRAQAGDVGRPRGAWRAPSLDLLVVGLA
jgi:hypothetical protein